MPQARVIAQDNGLCLFTGTFGRRSSRSSPGIPIATMRPGDVFMTNGPYGGGTHTADVALVMPIFAGDEVIAFGISVTHWTEIGGKVLGSLSPDSTEIFQEGLQFPQLRLYRAGELNAELVALIRENVRLPTMSIGDLSAGVAAVRIAAERLRRHRRPLRACRRRKRPSRPSWPMVKRSPAKLCGASHPVSMRQTTSSTATASAMIRSRFESGSPSPRRNSIADFTGTAPQTDGPINCARGALMSACKTVFKAITAPEAPSNEGLFAPLEVIAPDGTVFTAIRPAATGWYFESSAFATELMWKALAPVLPEHLSAGSYVSLCAYYIGGTRPDGSYWVQATPQDGGWGAGIDIDGESALIATTDGDTYNYPAEVIEHAFPLAMERNALNIEAAGGGWPAPRRVRHYPRVPRPQSDRGFPARLARPVRAAAMGRCRWSAGNEQLLRGRARRRRERHAAAASPIFRWRQAISSASSPGTAAAGAIPASASATWCSRTSAMGTSRPMSPVMSTASTSI